MEEIIVSPPHTHTHRFVVRMTDVIYLKCLKTGLMYGTCYIIYSQYYSVMVSSFS